MNLKEMITRHEADRLKRYRCPAGHWTIGRGWNMDAHPLPPDIASYERIHGDITQEMSDRLLDISIETATKQCQSLYMGFDGYPEARRFALIDFVFNVGVGTALKFRKMRAAISMQDWNRAADEMVDSDWFKQVGTRGPEIVGMVRMG